MAENFSRLTFTSPSLSYGKTTVQVDVLERNSQLNPRVSWTVGGKPFYRTCDFKCFEELNCEVARTSIYTKENLKLASPEHLAATFLLWPSRRFNVNLVDGATPEIPMMDGSALPFFYALRRTAGTPEDLFFYDAPVKAEWNLTKAGASKPYGYVRICPAETFEVEYVLDRPDLGGFGGSNARDSFGDANAHDGFKSAINAAIYSAGDLYHIFEARTFIHETELLAARNAGLLSGVDETCGMVLPKAKYRVDHEPARHKILDLIGDLAFVCPALPKIRVEILNGGHESHFQILKKVLPYVTGYSA